MCIIGSMFKDYKIIIFENDSTDGTNDFLQKFKQKQTQVSIITHPYCKNKYKYRTWCIAYGRQRCADALKSSGFVSQKGSMAPWIYPRRVYIPEGF